MRDRALPRAGEYVLIRGRPRLVVAAEALDGEGGPGLRLQTAVPGRESVESLAVRGRRWPRPARVERIASLYMYCDGESLVFMDPRGFEQYFLPAPIFGDKRAYLIEGEAYRLVAWRGRAIALELPRRLALKVVALGSATPPEAAGPAGQADPQAGTSKVPGATKPVTTETGLVLRVPLFVMPGDLILVDTGSNEYLERLEAGRSGRDQDRTPG